ncbi:MAG: hypothetical protein ACW98Y_15730 [Candidatus Thorarchaeota archaeon]
MLDRRIVATVLIVISISGVGILAVLLNGPSPSPSQIPPPSSPPGNETEIVTAGNLTVWAEAQFSQDFMPAIPPEGPPFYSFISINITNNGEESVSDISAHRITIYYNNSLNALVTLNITTVNQFFAPISVSPGESTVIDFINLSNEIYSPTIDQGTGLYGRILFSWNGNQDTILTTVPTSLLFTY